MDPLPCPQRQGFRIDYVVCVVSKECAHARLFFDAWRSDQRGVGLTSEQYQRIALMFMWSSFIMRQRHSLRWLPCSGVREVSKFLAQSGKGENVVI